MKKWISFCLSVLMLVSIFAPVGNAVSAQDDIDMDWEEPVGWVEQDGDIYYYPEADPGSDWMDDYYHSGVFKIDDIYYAFDEEGRLITERGLYTFPVHDDLMHGSIVADYWENNELYCDASGALFEEKKMLTYYVNRNGQCLTGWVKWNGKYYYFDEQAEMVNGRYTIGNNTYCFGEDGSLIRKPRWLKMHILSEREDKNDNYYLHEDSSWYYINKKGIVVSDAFQKIKKKWYYFNSYGERVIGPYEINGRLYLFNNKGVWQYNKGWKKYGGQWFYVVKKGVCKTGWLKINKKWHYFGEDGAMHAGWLKYNNRWYYFTKKGVLYTGWLKDGGKWYYLAGNGVMKTGWLKDGGKWYYFETNGVMLSNTSKKIGGKTYRFDKSGVCLNP